MKIVEQSCQWVRKPEGALELIELAGRTCYKSEDKITPGSAEKFVRMLNDRGHHSVIEHAVASVRFITNRGVTHELVRHRLASFSQESTRYVRYGDVEFIAPVWMNFSRWIWTYEDIMSLPRNAEWCFLDSCQHAEDQYSNLLDIGWRPEQAREVLPNALKTEIVMTANLREWLHVFRLRCSKAAHPQMRALALQCAGMFADEVPVLFEKWRKE